MHKFLKGGKESGRYVKVTACRPEMINIVGNRQADKTVTHSDLNNIPRRTSILWLRKTNRSHNVKKEMWSKIKGKSEIQNKKLVKEFREIKCVSTTQNTKYNNLTCINVAPKLKEERKVDLPWMTPNLENSMTTKKTIECAAPRRCSNTDEHLKVTKSLTSSNILKVKNK